MSTPHNAANAGDIAKAVLMPGDPLRAQFVAENYLQEVHCFNTVRNMFGYTGIYKGKRLSVMGSGMGIPSISLYAQELYEQYDVELILRMGSAGGISDQVHLRDLVLAMGASTDSNFQADYHLPGIFSATADFATLQQAYRLALAQQTERKQANVLVGNVISSDHFYHDGQGDSDAWKKMGILAVEMEAAGLYTVAARLHRKALAILTISDHLYTGEALSAKDREQSFTEMMQLALDTAHASV